MNKTWSEQLVKWRPQRKQLQEQLCTIQDLNILCAAHILCLCCALYERGIDLCAPIVALGHLGHVLDDVIKLRFLEAGVNIRVS